MKYKPVKINPDVKIKPDLKIKPVVKINPDVKKIFLLNITKIAIILSIIISIVVIFDLIELVDVFIGILELFNINIAQMQLVYLLIFLVSIIAFVTIVINYLIISALSYEFYKDRLIYGEISTIVFKNVKEINYKNITRIYFSTESWINQLFNTGTINIDLTGMDKASIKLEFIDDIKQVTSNLQGLIDSYKVKTYSMVAGRKKIGKLKNKGNI